MSAFLIYQRNLTKPSFEVIWRESHQSPSMMRTIRLRQSQKTRESKFGIDQAWISCTIFVRLMRRRVLSVFTRPNQYWFAALRMAAYEFLMLLAQAWLQKIRITVGELLVRTRALCIQLFFDCCFTVTLPQPWPGGRQSAFNAVKVSGLVGMMLAANICYAECAKIEARLCASLTILPCVDDIDDHLSVNPVARSGYKYRETMFRPF